MPTNNSNVHSHHHAKVTKTQILKRAGIEAVTGAGLGGVSGFFGKAAISMFNHSAVHHVGSLTTFAAVGAIAAPLIFIPTLISDYLIEESESLRRCPNLKSFLKDTARLCLQIGAVASAAAMMSTPIGPTVLCMMIIPAIFYLVKSICNLVNAVEDNEPALPQLSNSL